MSGLDAFIPGENDLADLPEALTNFARWVEQQKTAMEATVRAEVAKVDQATITANVLAQVPVGIGPFKIESHEGNSDRTEGVDTQIPEGAVSVKVSARGGPAIANGERGIGDCFTGRWDHIVLDLRELNRGGVQFETALGQSWADLETDRHTSVSLKTTRGVIQEVPLLWAAGAKHGGAPGAPQTNGLSMIRNETATGRSLVAAKVIFEWFKTPLPGAVPLTVG